MDYESYFNFSFISAKSVYNMKTIINVFNNSTYHYPNFVALGDIIQKGKMILYLNL